MMVFTLNSADSQENVYQYIKKQLLFQITKYDAYSTGRRKMISLWFLDYSNISLKTGLTHLGDSNSPVELIFSPYILFIMAQDMFQY